MTIKVERTKKEFLQDDSCLASEDLSNFKFCAVAPGGGATGNMTVGAPSGQGVMVYAILQNTPASGEICELTIDGITEVRIDSAITAGDEVTVAGVNGRIETAASGDFVLGWAREAGVDAGQCISVTLSKGYYKP